VDHPIRVLITDDHDIVRKGIRALLATEKDIKVVGEAADGAEAKIFVAEWTVRTHVSNILGKLHLASRTQAALYALRSGLASLDDVPASE
jgi:DNA-binding NarL/FixJ family response regulator